MRLCIVLAILIGVIGCETKNRSARERPAEKQEKPELKPPGTPGAVALISGPPMSVTDKQIKIRAFMGDDGSSPGKQIEDGDYIRLNDNAVDMDIYMSTYNRNVITAVTVGCPGAPAFEPQDVVKADLIKICGKVDLTKVQILRSKILELDSAEIRIEDTGGISIGEIHSEELILRGENIIELKAVAERESKRNLIFSFSFISENGNLQINTRGKDGRSAQ